VLFHNLLTLSGPVGAVPAAVRDGHLFSAYLMMPLAATTLALLAFNWYPAQVSQGRCWRPAVPLRLRRSCCQLAARE
jgi:UDP-N-acetylglucosamine--dolichyl-phosphate N-acetylglucosaminephosphotransferase